MKVIKNKENYSITLSEKEVDNLIHLVDLYPMAWALGEIQDQFWKAKSNGQWEEKLKNWNYFPPEN